VCFLLVLDVTRRVSHEEHREGETQCGHDRRADPDRRPRGDGGGRDSGREGGDGDSQVSGGLVQAERETSPDGADEIDLHDDGHRPGEALSGTEEEIGGDDRLPRRSERDQRSNGEHEHPPGDEDTLSPPSFGERAGEKIRESLRGAEGRDEREDPCPRGESVFLLGDERQDAAFEPRERAHQRRDPDEQRELTGVRPQPDTKIGHAAARVRPARFAATIAS
jgi:hypothetical protein